jgi:NADH-quinone oxidoreductase subunit L
MGGLRRKLPLTFWVFLIASLALTAIPPTAGFASKDLILSELLAGGPNGAWLWIAGLVGALLTSIYTFRMVFLTFFGPSTNEPAGEAGPVMGIPMLVLSFCCVAAGLLNFPAVLGGSPVLVDFLERTLPSAPAAHVGAGTEVALLAVSVLASLAGIVVAWVLYVGRPELVRRVVLTPAGGLLHRFWLAGWGFDRLYDACFVRPLSWAARVNRDDFVDSFYRGLALLSVMFHVALARTETGRVRWYVAGVACGAVILVAILVLL